MTLDQAIREAADTGRLDGLTLWKCPDGWQGNARRAGSDGWVVCIDEDPVRALIGALGGKITAPVKSDLSHGVFD